MNFREQAHARDLSSMILFVPTGTLKQILSLSFVLLKNDEDFYFPWARRADT